MLKSVGIAVSGYVRICTDIRVKPKQSKILTATCDCLLNRPSLHLLNRAQHIVHACTNLTRRRALVLLQRSEDATIHVISDDEKLKSDKHVAQVKKHWQKRASMYCPPQHPRDLVKVVSLL